MLPQCTHEFKSSICDSLNTSVDKMEDDVNTLREWIQSQPHLPQNPSDSLLTHFLIACKSRLERTKQKINNFYTARAKLPEFFADRDPRNERFQEVGKEIPLFLLPKLTPDGCDVTMTRLNTGDPKKYGVTTFTKRFLMQEDLKLETQAFSKGRYFVIDGTKFSISHILRLNPKLLRKLIYCAQDVLPINIKGIIFINAPSVFDILFNLIKPLFKYKLLQRIHIYKDGPEVLDKYFPKKLLPKDYGGEEASSEFLNERWLEYLESKRDWLMKEDNKSNREKIKQKDQQNESFTPDNSFRNLNID